jgi:hypothetical protein
MDFETILLQELESQDKRCGSQENSSEIISPLMKKDGSQTIHVKTICFSVEAGCQN